MGRQAYLTRLALGRSAFEPPLRDEHGEFILGPHANEDSAKGYIQQFNSSGHPLNIESEVAARRFRRAQNEVQAIAGILERKNKAAVIEQKFARKNNDKVIDLRQESHIARISQIFYTPTLSAGIWWIVAFRRRLMTFRTYHETEMVSQLSSDINSYGLKNFLFSGFLTKAVASICGTVRSNLHTSSDNKLTLYRPADTWALFFNAKLVQTWVLDFALFCVQWPLLAVSDLQVLQLINTLRPPRPKLLWSLAYRKWTNLADSTTTFNLSLLTRSGLVFPTSPFIVAYLRDVVQAYIRVIIFRIIRHFTIKPDRPDKNSVDAADGMKVDKDLVAGLGLLLTMSTEQRYHGPRTFLGVLEALYPNAYKLWCTITGTPVSSQPGQLTPFNEDQILADANAHYRRFRLADDAIPSRTLTYRAVHAAFADHFIDPREEGLDIDDWATKIEQWSPGPATNPEPQELIESLDLNARPDRTSPTNAIEELWQAPYLSQTSETISTNENQQSSMSALNDTDLITTEQATNNDTLPTTEAALEESFSPTIPLEALLNTVPVDDHLLPAEPPQTPVPGLARANLLPQTHPRPVRRPTDINDLFEVESMNSGSNQEARRLSHRAGNDQKYRVTLLSNLPADTFAILSSVVLTDLIMLPLDMYYFRLLARTFLQTGGLPDTNTSSLAGMSARVLPTGGLLGLRGSGVRSFMNYSSSILLTYALQVVVSSLLWQGGKALVLRLGRYYGWEASEDR